MQILLTSFILERLLNQTHFTLYLANNFIYPTMFLTFLIEIFTFLLISIQIF